MCHESWHPESSSEDPRRSRVFTASDGARIPGWAYGDDGTKGTCLLLPDIFGPSPFYHHVAGLLGQSGFHTVMVDYFFREGALQDSSREAAFERRSSMDENLCLSDISRVLSQLTEDGTDRTIGVVGFCLSGTFAFDLTTMRDDLATVSFYGFPEGPGGPVASAAPRPIDVAARFQGPILAFWGDQDRIPVSDLTKFESEALTHGADYRQHIYPGAGHGFLQGLVEERPDSASARDAWSRTLAFLGSHVTSKS